MGAVSLVALGPVATPVAQGAAVPDGWLDSVSCPTDTMCFAVGYDTTIFVMRWNGATWTRADLPLPSAGEVEPRLNLSCVSASRCYAIGLARTGHDEKRPFVATWNGVKWTSKVLSMKATHWDLADLSCATPTACIAVGEVRMSTSDRHSAALRWNGVKWTVMATPLTNGWDLYGVSCRAPASCVAVGSRRLNATSQPWVIRWNGKAWKTMTSPKPASKQLVRAYDVSCPVAARCHAVGSAFGGNNYGFVLSESGDAWTLANKVSGRAGLGAVSCASATDCFAVGSKGPYDQAQKLIMRWDGTTWSTSPSPSVGSPKSGLSDVSCSSPNNCHAIGSLFAGPSERLRPFALRWNGTSWSRTL